MTGVVETPFGRRSLLRGAVGLAVALVLPAATQRPASADGATGSTRIVPAGKTGSYLVLAPGAITVYSGKVELGTGVQTALSQIVLDELHLPWQPISYVQGDTLLTTDEGYTAGSKTTQTFGVALRQAAATAFQALLTTAAAQAGVGTAQLKVKNGIVSYRSYRATYDQLLAAAGPRVLTASSSVPLRDPGDYAVVGSSVDRVDLPAKTQATFPFVCDVTVPGMLHGRVVRPAGRNSHVASYDDTAARAVPGVVGVYRQQDFLGVVATSEYAASAGAAALSVTWTSGQPLLAHDDLPTELRDQANRFAQNTGDPLNTPGDFDAALTSAATKLTASYDTPFHMHGTAGASSAVADVSTDGSGTVQSVEAWSGTQGVFPLARALASLLGTTTDKVTIHYVEASGCYGHDGADDATADAALLSKLAGKPVRVQWTRAQEHGWEPLGSAMAHDLAGGLDAGGNVVAWEHTVYSAVHNARPTIPAGTVLAGILTGSPPAPLSPNPFDNAARNAPVTYAFPNRRLTTNLVKTFEGTTDGKGNLAASAPLTYRLPRTTALRSLGGFSNTFANESFLDELAHAAGRDPLEIRRSALTADARALAVLDALGPTWRKRPTGSGVGAGLAYQQYEVAYTYVAVYAEALVDPVTGAVRVRRVVVAHDCGLVINPDGLRHQIEGNVIQGVSRTLHEDVRYDGDAVTSVNWETNAFITDPTKAYPVIRFDEVPEVEVLLLDRPTEPAWGAGEAAIGPVGAAIANAVFAASGRRVRRLPMTPDRVLATPVTA